MNGNQVNSSQKQYRKLSEVPFDELKVGDRLISYRKNPGVISELIVRPIGLKEKDPDNLIVWMEWEDGHKSSIRHYLTEYVLYVEDYPQEGL